MASMVSLNLAMVLGQSIASSPCPFEELAEFPAGAVPQRIAAMCSAMFNVDAHCSLAAYSSSNLSLSFVLIIRAIQQEVFNCFNHNTLAVGANQCVRFVNVEDVLVKVNVP